MKKKILICGLAAAITLAAAPTAAAEPREVRVASHVSALSPLHQQSEMFAAEVERRLPGQFKFQLFPGGQLGNEKALITNVKAGALEMINVASGVLKLDKKLGLFDLPWLFSDRAHVRRAMTTGLEDAVRARIEDVAGVKVVGVYENGFRHVINAERAVRTPGDLRGAENPDLRREIPAGGFSPTGRGAAKRLVERNLHRASDRRGRRRGGGDLWILRAEALRGRQAHEPDPACVYAVVFNRLPVVLGFVVERAAAGL